jgi:hypothetical protein
MRAGTALTQLIEFSEGFPDGDISWGLLDASGNPLANGAVTPEADSASAVIMVPALDNDIVEAGALFAYRELSWSYTVGGLMQNGRRRYRLEAFLPLGVSEDGVRRKLGVESHELEDEKIDLVTAYSSFRETVTAAKLDAVTNQTALAACDGIEALAALNLLPTLQISLAAKESSGTNQFQRTKIDWDRLRAHLETILANGYAAVNPLSDTSSQMPSLLTVVVRPDPIVGET